MAKKWMGTPPKKCDICELDIKKVFIDGVTSRGWACRCQDCHHFHGRGLGLGLGQEYKKKGDDWVKTRG